MAVYDKETDQSNKPLLGRSDLAKKEQAASSSSDQAAKNQPNQGINDERDFFTESAQSSIDTNNWRDKLLSRFGSKKLLAGGIGGGLLGTLLVIGGLLGYLNVFKADHIMKNVEYKTHIRYQAAIAGRSDKWIQSYVLNRLTEIDNFPDPDLRNRTMLFKAEKVSTGYGPSAAFDWYRNWRTSNFEIDLKKEYGIEFSSAAYYEDDMIKFRTAAIYANGKEEAIHLEGVVPETTLSLDDFKNGTGKYSNIMSELGKNTEVDIFASHKDARRAIKQAVNAKTKPWQVIKRRHIRKWIQNKTGTRSWRFFEKTRDKIAEKVTRVRNKIIKAMLPDTTVLGRIVQCVFGVTMCRGATDGANPDNRATTRSASTGNPKNEEETTYQTTEPDGSTTTHTVEPTEDMAGTVREGTEALAREGGEEALELSAKEALATRIAKGFLSKGGATMNILSWLDMFNMLNESMANGSLTKMVIVARGIQAMGLYTTMQTAVNQMTTGQLTLAEASEFMRTMGSVSNSEGWVSVLNNNGSAVSAEEEVKFATSRDGYCSEDHQNAIEANPRAYENEFHYLCDDKRIGGPSTGASIQDWWNKYVGSWLGPLLTFYNDTFLKDVMGVVNDVFGWLFNGLMSVVKAILPASVEKNLADAFGWVIGKIASALGAGPMMSGNEPSGVYMNMIVQGAAYTAEDSARNTGAAATTSLTRNLSDKMVANYYNEYYDEQSLFDRYISLNNPDSTLSKTLFATIENTTVNNIAGLFSQIVENVAKIPLNIFSKPALAGTEDPYAAAKFAGIETYDFPQECFDLDPMTMTPPDVTNADDSGIIPASELTWDIVNNSEAFSTLLFSKLHDMYGDGDIDQYSKPIYNCGALDNAVRSGLGFVYGYDDDYGGVYDGYGGGSIASTGSCEGLTLTGPERGHGGVDSETGVNQVGNHDQYLLPRNNPGYTTNHDPEYQWGRKELIQTIWQIGLKWAQAHPEGPKIVVAGLDESDGHKSHVNGVDVDFVSGPMYMKASGYEDKYDINLSIELGKIIMETGNINMIFYDDPPVQNAVNAFARQNNLSGEMRNPDSYAGATDSHWNHFHVRIKPGVTPLGCQ